MTDPLDRNRLDEEESPYLREHADNPVNWQPWDERALAAARQRDRPIFLSVGYSACHWCHVMEEESFQDDGVAELLNESFVPIKVDREERPDLDRIYQTVCRMIAGGGGWPLSVWLTPEGEPFYVGTYFPREEKRGTPAFPDLLENIRDSWEDPEQRAEMENRAEQWAAAATDRLEEPAGEPAEPDESLLTDAADAAVRSADREHGGFGRGQKFPQPARLHLLLRAHERDPRDAYRAVVAETLDAMANGGIYDHLGGGFHRYATDREWVVPHFEKMLYDNAEIPRAFIEGYRATGDERYAEVARETFEFLDRELSHPDGGLYSTLDARSEPPEGGDPEEGACYVWTPEDVRAAIDDPDLADLAMDRYGVTDRGNFEGETVLTIDATVDELAADRDADPATVEDRLATARDRLFEYRSERPRPRRDEKVIAGWNGLAISALAEGGLALGDRYAERATEALSFVREHLWDGDAGRLSRRYKDGDVKGDGYLEDYAFLARGALDCYQATGDVEGLVFAMELAETIVDAFWDAEDGTLYFTPEYGESLITRPQEPADQSTPSSLGVALEVLLALDHLRPDDEFAEVAGEAVETHAQRIESGPLQHATLAMAADRYRNGHFELTVVADGIPADWRDRIGATYLPGRLLSRRPADDATLSAWLDDLGLDEAPPIWANRGQRDDAPTVYACRSFTCSPPETDLDAALEWAAENL